MIKPISSQYPALNLGAGSTNPSRVPIRHVGKLAFMWLLWGILSIAQAQLSNSGWARYFANSGGTNAGQGYGTLPIVKWSYTTPPLSPLNLTSNPCVDPNGNIYTGLSGGSNTQGGVVAMNGQTGAILWTTTLAGSISAPPAIDVSGVLYVGTNIRGYDINGKVPVHALTQSENTFYAIDSKTGNVLWSIPDLENVVTAANIGPDGTVYFATAPDNSSSAEYGTASLYSVSPLTGKINWTFTTAQLGVEDYFQYLFDIAIGVDGTVYAGNFGCTYAIDHSSGKPLWTIDEDSGDIMIGPDGNLVSSQGVSPGPGYLCKLNSQTGDRIWSVALPPVYFAYAMTGVGDVVLLQEASEGLLFEKLSGTDGSVIWSENIGSGTDQVPSSPVIAGDGTIYVLVGANEVAYNGSNGAQLWIYPIASPNHQNLIGAIAADGTAYMVTGNGITALDSLHVTSITVNPSVITGGQSSTGTVTLSGPAPTGGFLVTLSESDDSPTIPTTVLIPAGTSTATFPITTVPTGGQYFDRISALPGINQTATLTVNAPSITSITFTPSTLTGGATSTGTVTINAPAPSYGLTVQLSSNNSAATVQPSVTIAPGQTSITFPVTTTGVAAVVDATITGQFIEDKATATLVITPPILQALSVSPATIQGGATATGTVTLSGIAPPIGDIVTTSSSNSAASVYGFTVVQGGQTTATFSINTSAVTSQTTATITALLSGVQLSQTITITPAALVSVSLSPASLVGGTQSTGTITLNGPAPTGGTTVALSSSSTSASVPTALTIAAGQSTGTFTVTTTGVNTTTNASISAKFNGVTQSATLTINPPGISGFTVSPASLVGGSNATGTLTLSGPAAPGGTSVTLSSTTPTVAPPATVLVPAGTSSTTVTIPTRGTNTTVTATITANLGGSQQLATLTVTPPALLSVNIAPTSVFGGTNAMGTVSLSGPAAPLGAIVSLSASSSAGSVPSTVTVAAGQTTGTFTVTTTPVTTAVFDTITAAFNGISQTASLAIKNPTLVSLTLNPTTVAGQSTATGTLLLSGPAPSGGANFTLSSSNSMAVPATYVSIPSGQTSATFNILTVPVTATTYATISATSTFGSGSATLTLQPITMIAFTLSPTTVKGGGSSTGTVLLNGLSPTNTVIHLKSNLSGVAVPSTVTIIQGQLSQTFTVKTTAVSANKTAMITATLGSTTLNQTLNVLAPTLVSLTVSPTTVTGTVSSTGTVTISSPAPSGGMSVKLSSNSTSAKVSATAVIAAGKTSENFTIKTSAVTSQTTATLTASLNGITDTATLTLVPPLLLTFTLEPATVIGGKTSTGKVTLNAPAPIGGIVIQLTSSESNASVPSTIAISAGQTSKSFTVKTTKPAQNVSAVLSATLGNNTLTQTLHINN